MMPASQMSTLTGRTEPQPVGILFVLGGGEIVVGPHSFVGEGNRTDKAQQHTGCNQSMSHKRSFMKKESRQMPAHCVLWR